MYIAYEEDDRTKPVDITNYAGITPKIVTLDGKNAVASPLGNSKSSSCSFRQGGLDDGRLRVVE
jgi:hypothetical protein